MEGLTGVVGTISGSLLAWVPFLGLAAGFAVVMWRTRSLHLLLRRFWLLVHGSKDIPDPDIRAFVDEQTSLQSFRLFSGVSVSTLDNAKLLMAWCRQYGIPISKISECRDCFDADERRVREERIPSKKFRIACVLGGVLIYLCGTLSLGGAFYAADLVKFRATGRWVFVSENHVSRAFSMPLMASALDVRDCNHRVPQKIMETGFSPDEVDAFCSTMGTPDWKQRVAEIKSQQRCFFALSAMGFAVFFYFFIYRPVNKWIVAKEVKEKVQAPDASSASISSVDSTDVKSGP
ncbi:MAG: DUF6216 family protein [Burkholderiaceae bacterium]|jgi:hypothetical protein|nr:DUF6216 family protein [Burkholderiaceae bacterium]